MEALKSTIDITYIYLNNNVIFKISPNNNGDPCAKKAVETVKSADTEVAIPYITVNGDKLFLTNLIEAGDKYTASNGFTKHDDGNCSGITLDDGNDSGITLDDGNDSGITLDDGNCSGLTLSGYYTKLCEEQIMFAIKSKPTADFYFFNRNKNMLGIPLYMINGQATVTGIDQITFDKTYFDNLKNKVVQEEAWKAANNKAREYGYKVTSEVSGLTVSGLTVTEL
jgi:hypothetical protein